MTTTPKTARGSHMVKTQTEGHVLSMLNRHTGEVFLSVDLDKIPQESLHKFAIHGMTQNLLDSSNKLEGEARVRHLQEQAAIVQAGGWASAPREVNLESAKARMLAALVASGKSPEEAATLLALLKV